MGVQPRQGRQGRRRSWPTSAASSGVLATTDRDALIALKPDAIVHTAMADDRVFECIEDLIGVRRGRHQRHLERAGAAAVAREDPAAGVPRPDREAACDGQRSLHVNGIDPGFANDVLPLVMTSLSQRIDEVRVMEICDYSTYYQPVVMGDMFGFGRPMDYEPFLWQPGILTMAWGSVVRQIAAGLDIVLDEPLTEEVERRAAERDTDVASPATSRPGTMGAVRFQLIGKVDGVPRVVLEHVTRTDRRPEPEWPQPAGGDGCYRVIDHRRADDAARLHPPRRARRPQRQRHDHHRPAHRQRRCRRSSPRRGGLVTALDLPLVTGRGLVSTT